MVELLQFVQEIMLFSLPLEVSFMSFLLTESAWLLPVLQTRYLLPRLMMESKLLFVQLTLRDVQPLRQQLPSMFQIFLLQELPLAMQPIPSVKGSIQFSRRHQQILHLLIVFTSIIFSKILVFQQIHSILP